MKSTVCSVDGCGKSAKTRGWCGMHYERWRIRGGPLAPSLRAQKRKCAVEGCDHPYDSRGYCLMHLRRWKKHGNPLYVKARPKHCSVMGCEKKPRGYGYCALHYRRWKDHGTTDKPVSVVKKPILRTREDGYKIYKIGGRQFFEHRLVMEKQIGRPLLKSEVVHHKDGDKGNNDPSNLEITTPHDHSLMHHWNQRFRSGTHKECLRCGAILSRSEFYPSPYAAREADPHRACCKKCHNAQTIENAKKRALK